MHKPTLLLIDGSSYLYRAFHAMPNLTNSHGQATGAVYGFINMLKRLLMDYAPVQQAAVVFDAKGNTFRHDLYPEYKANRAAMPEDLISQIDFIHTAVKALGFPLLMVEQVEADDVMGTLALQAEQAGMKVLLFTGDKDMAQVVNANIHMVDTMKDVELDEAEIVEKFGVKPSQIVDYLSLVGDSSDNVKGVNKVGAKTAVKWLNQYDSLANIINHADEFKGKVGEYLREAITYLPLTQQLITLKTDVTPLPQPQDLLCLDYDEVTLIDLYQQLEFKSWLAELTDDKPVTKTAVELDYELILTQAQLDTWLAKIQTADLVTIDTETTSLDYRQARLVGLSFAVEPHQAAYLPLAHDYLGVQQQLDFDNTLALLKPLLENPQLKKVGQNIKYDCHVLSNHGIHLQGISFDTLIEASILDSQGRHDMDTLATKYLDQQTIHYEDIAGKGKKQLSFNQIELAVARDYASEDADVCLRLHQCLYPQLQNDLLPVFNDIEMPLLPVLARMEQTGVKVDASLLQQQSQVLAQTLTDLQAQAFELAGEEFNLNSPKQLQVILFEKLELPVIKKTPKGQASTAEPILQELAKDYPLPQLILQYRHLSKLKSTYTDKLPQQIDPQTGRVHTSYQQMGAATGRLSSSNPNLQNIPTRTAEGRQIRQAFTAPQGYQIVAADYSQIELRIIAHLSNDEGLCKAFSQGLDVHRATASEVFDCSLDEVTKEQRRRAKAINFGLIYGMSAYGLGVQLDIPRSEAQAYIDRYFERYPKVKAYMDSTRESAREQGFVSTIHGRRLHLTDINSRNKQRQQAAERAAINAPMQGTAADIIKKAMIAIDTWICSQKPDVKMTMQVHDELVFEVANAEVETALVKIKTLMENVVELNVPLLVDVGVGEHWDAAH